MMPISLSVAAVVTVSSSSSEVLLCMPGWSSASYCHWLHHIVVVAVVGHVLVRSECCCACIFLFLGIDDIILVLQQNRL